MSGQRPGLTAEGPQTEPKPGRCNAKLRNSRNAGSLYCPNYPVTGATRCRMHGGTTPTGADSPHWTGRGRSKALPLRLAERVSRHLTDPEATEMLFDIAVVSARIDELLAQFDTGESGGAWNQVQRTVDLLQADVDSESVPDALVRSRLKDQLTLLHEALTLGAHEQSLFSELFEVQKHRAKLVETELKREERLEQSLTAKQAVALVGVVKQLLFEFVQDPGQRRLAATRLSRLLTKRDPESAPASPKLLEAAIERVEEAKTDDPDHEITA